MPNLRIVLSDWDLQELFRGRPLSLSGEAKPNEIALDFDNIHWDSVQSTIAALIRRQKQREGGGQNGNYEASDSVHQTE